MQFSSAPAQLASVASNADMQTVLGRLTAARALALDNLDELVSLTEQRKAVAGGPGSISEPDGAWAQPQSSAVAWTYGAWSQLTAATATAETILGIAMSRQASANIISAGEIQIGVGAGGSEVVYDTRPFAGGAATTDPSSQWIPLVLPVKVAAGARIAVRVKQNIGAVCQYNVQLSVINPANVQAWSI